MLSARNRFLFAGVATVVGVALLAGYGWLALAEVSDDAQRMKGYLRHLRAVELVEEDLHELAARSPGARVESLDRHLEVLRETLIDDDERQPLAELERRLAQARARPTPEAWSSAAEVLSTLGKAGVERAAKALEASAKPVESSAERIVRLGAGVVVVCGVLAALAFLRLRRERRSAEAQIRRSDRLAALGTMAASVAHELNNPLMTISGCATAVRDRLRRRAAEHPDEIEYLDMVVDETRRCSGIVRSLRDLARDTPPAMAPYDLAALAREVVGLVEMTREGPKVAYEVAGEAPLEIVCDPDKVKQLLLNLVVNARDACSEGGRVRVTLDREDGAARIVVEDDGRGIAAKDLPRIFEPFHTDKTRGLGLGLFVCDRIVSLHGGRIRAASDGPGRGARFTVVLPAELPGPVPAARG